MRSLILMSIVLLVSSCGQTRIENELLDEVGLCFALDLSCGEENDDKFNNIQTELDKLHALIQANRDLININQTNINTVDADLSLIINDLQVTLNTVQSQASVNAVDIVALQNAISDVEAMQANGVVEVIDPCGDMAGEFDEIILRLNSGEHVAYFESGGKRFLSVLGNGSFQTTDKQKCNFSIVNGVLVD
jgi:hypothetical protein